MPSPAAGAPLRRRSFGRCFLRRRLRDDRWTRGDLVEALCHRGELLLLGRRRASQRPQIGEQFLPLAVGERDQGDGRRCCRVGARYSCTMRDSERRARSFSPARISFRAALSKASACRSFGTVRTRYATTAPRIDDAMAVPTSSVRTFILSSRSGRPAERTPPCRNLRSESRFPLG